MKKSSKAQASIEVVAVISLVFFLYGILIYEVIQRNAQATTLSDEMRKRVVCETMAEAITGMYKLGEGGSVKLNLTHGYNISILGTEGFISVGIPQEGVSCEEGCIYEGVSCRMPEGMMDGYPTFTNEQREFIITNINGTVVVEVA
ncbi:MAG: hypothetical protein KKD39_02135 [Candidatus Altiarchaeota archaeon]|nr:hypothetical protein [Candidatus Altiarchaeota archaeon]